MAAMPDGSGYWEVASDGGTFSFRAPFYGSRAGLSAVDRFFSMLPTSHAAGYLLMGQHPAG
jgi:hypothetical protein